MLGDGWSSSSWSASVLAYATIKFKARTEADEHAEPPPQSHGNPLVEVGLIGGSVLALVIIAFPTLKSIRYTYDIPSRTKGRSLRGDGDRRAMVVQVRVSQRADSRRRHADDRQ